jgi:hypothetical protein
MEVFEQARFDAWGRPPAACLPGEALKHTHCRGFGRADPAELLSQGQFEPIA